MTTLLNVDWQTLENAPAPGTVLCQFASLVNGEPQEYSFAADQAAPAFRVLVHRHGDKVSAYVNQCPHQWLPLNRGDGKFVEWSEHQVMCAHHSAVFDLARSGICLMGPCQGSNLIAVPVGIVRDQVVIAPHA